MRRVCSVKYISKADSLEGLVLQWREREKKRKLHRQVEVDMVDEPQRKICVVDVLSEALAQNIYFEEGDTLSTPKLTMNKLFIFELASLAEVKIWKLCCSVPG